MVTEVRQSQIREKVKSPMRFGVLDNIHMHTYKHFLMLCSISTFIATLFTAAKTWKQHKCPLTDEWIKKIWHICVAHTHIYIHIHTYPLEYYSAIKKNYAICSNMDAPRDYLTK